MGESIYRRIYRILEATQNMEHPKAWVVRMVEGRGLKVAEKTLY